MTEDSEKAMIIKHGPMVVSMVQLLDHINGQSCWEEYNWVRGEERATDTQQHLPAANRFHQDDMDSVADTSLGSNTEL